MKDFQPQTHELLLNKLIQARYRFSSFSDYMVQNTTTRPAEDQPLIILRHDVERYYPNALTLAQIQYGLGITGTYYFRLLPHAYNANIIKQIAKMGHEIGYHYDDLTASGGDFPKAWERFQKNLQTLRNIAPVTSITMDGSPLSKYDNRNLWQKYDYKKLGILAEPYFDLDFNQIFYITDTGRRWDGHLFNVRDKATKENPVTNQEFLKLRFHSTFDLIQAIEKGAFPKQAMLNFHPQRWNSNPYLWTKELVMQNLKNQVKRFLVK